MAKLEIPVVVDIDAVAELIEELKDLQTYKLGVGDDIILVDRDEVVEIFKNHVKAKQREERKTGRWIPCKPVNDNYLPDLKDDYKMILVTYRTGRSMVRKVKACLCDHGRLEKKVPGIVTAWMPYPDPYVEIEL